jgi:hypothetical protein
LVIKIGNPLDFLKTLVSALNAIAHLFIRCTRGGWGGRGRLNIQTPQANFKTFVDKNAIKAEIGGHHWQFFLKDMTHLGISAKTSSTLSPWFSTHVHLWSDEWVKQTKLFCFCQIFWNLLNHCFKLKLFEPNLTYLTYPNLTYPILTKPNLTFPNLT